MPRRRYTVVTLLTLAPGALVGQSQQAPIGTSVGTYVEPLSVPSQVSAVRIESSAPSIDGRLDDEAWSHAPPLAQLVQKEPVEGVVPSESTEVRFVYDNRALYVAFRAYDRQPERVYGRLMRRDGRMASDQFSLYIDSYNDHRTSYQFQLNPSGARRDVFIYNDGGGQDDSWDPVYDWATQQDSLGWTAELRIPFSQLRFPSRDSITFGVRVQRMINRRNEELNWPFF
ncbi:MAG: hypothetical protein AMS18_17775, partial [Gemmatimonas sp. SG8_17]